ncbi:MAG: hypothetical protein H6Q13_21 [Bacteroidetes bacterium]|nr:hypothetical protein [Bacteroidota bacterium]
MTENKNYLQKYAMHFGTYMGAYWVLKFILFPLGLTIPFLLFLFIGLTLGVPFMGYYYARMYRNKICGGEISFVQAWIFTVFMYMFAALLTAMAHFIYFRFIDQGFIINTYTALLDNALQAGVPGMGTYIGQFKEAMEVARSLSPIDITLQLLSQNVFYGSILAIPTALIVMNKKKAA